MLSIPLPSLSSVALASQGIYRHDESHSGVECYIFRVIFDTRTAAMSISTFFVIQSTIFCTYCFLPILKFYPVEQISVQFILSIIRIEALHSKF